MGKLIRNGIEYGGGNGTDIFEVTQAEYDALKQAGTLVHNALYVITDAPNLNPTADDIEYQSGVTVADSLDSLNTNKLNKSALKYIVGTGTTDANGILTATAMGVAQLDFDHHIILAVQSSYNGTCVNVGQYNKNFYFVCTSASGLANPIANTNLTIRIIYMDKWW